MKPTLATILGTAALGLLKSRIGSSVKIKIDVHKLVEIPEMVMRTYATHLDYLGININELFDNPNEHDQGKRLILFPVPGSSIILGAGLYLSDIDISDEDENMDTLYNVYWTYVIEPYDENLVLDQQTINHIKDMHHEICLAFNEAMVKAAGNDVFYDEDGYEFNPGNFEEFMGTYGALIMDQINDLRFISVPEFFIMDNRGRKRPLRDFIKLKRQTSKLRKR